MVKLLCVLGCVLSALAGGAIIRVAPHDPVIWLVVFLFGCAFACFWVELNR